MKYHLFYGETMGFLNKLKEKFGTNASAPAEDTEINEYVELDTDTSEAARAKVLIRPFVIEEFEHVKPILDVLRDGNTIALINIKPLKDKDIIELKRAINKLKKTCDAIEGDIAGFGENWIAAAPSFASIYRGKQSKAMSGAQEVEDDGPEASQEVEEQ